MYCKYTGCKVPDGERGEGGERGEDQLLDLNARIRDHEGSLNDFKGLGAYLVLWWLGGSNAVSARVLSRTNIVGKPQTSSVGRLIFWSRLPPFGKVKLLLK